MLLLIVIIIWRGFFWYGRITADMLFGWFFLIFIVQLYFDRVWFGWTCGRYLLGLACTCYAHFSSLKEDKLPGMMDSIMCSLGVVESQRINFGTTSTLIIILLWTDHHDGWLDRYSQLYGLADFTNDSTDSRNDGFLRVFLTSWSFWFWVFLSGTGGFHVRTVTNYLSIWSK